MRITFRRAPAIFQYGCFMAEPGLKLEPSYRNTGRPEVIRKILAVDDHHKILYAIRRIFATMPSEIVLIDPEQPIRNQVINYASQGDIDLIIMDGEMPQTSGMELTQELRKIGFTGYILANSSNQQMQEKMIDAGADFANPVKAHLSNLRNFFES